MFQQKNEEYKKGSNSNLRHRDIGMLNSYARLHSAFKDVLKVCFRQRRRNILKHTLYAESKKKYKNGLVCEAETDSQALRMSVWFPGR